MCDDSKKAGEGDVVSRRGFVASAGRWATGLGAGALTLGALRFTWPNAGTGNPGRLPLGQAAQFRVGSLTWVREHELFVLHDESGFGVFSSRCTHLGCTVRRADGGFVCPCHGARYDPHGLVLEGPARRALPWYRIELQRDGQLWVNRGEQVEPGTLVAPPIPAEQM